MSEDSDPTEHLADHGAFRHTARRRTAFRLRFFAIVPSPDGRWAAAAAAGTFHKDPEAGFGFWDGLVSHRSDAQRTAMLSEILPKRQILIFHGVGSLPSRALDPGERNFWSEESTLSKAINSAVQDRNIEISFDDGNISDLKIAAPLLAAKGMSATFFVLGGRIGWPDFLSAQDIRELDRMGMVIGSHGMDHVHWPAMDDAALHRELAVSKSLLEDILGKPVLEAAVPFGDFDGRSLRKALSVGYAKVYTSSGGFASKAMRVQPRTSVRDEAYPVLAAKERLLSGVRNHLRLLKHRVNGYAPLTSPGQV